MCQYKVSGWFSLLIVIIALKECQLNADSVPGCIVLLCVISCFIFWENDSLKNRMDSDFE